ncbi:CcdB family protein [Sphingobium sp. KCTC 72723]|uniref:CcdB family protein n=1 Tax=Sphingobium sp. KCTC 72723 TaxID=2733867 RepID=UPI00165E5FFE|nr:CcdB family protein [Sphingobium sp. KCTC 72723]
MARFDLYRLGDVLVIDCQADVLNHVSRRVVVPLVAPDEVPAPIARLHPLLQVDRQTYVMATHQIASVPVRFLGKPVGSVREHQDNIAAALEMLLIGF